MPAGFPPSDDTLRLGDELLRQLRESILGVREQIDHARLLVAESQVAVRSADALVKRSGSSPDHSAGPCTPQAPEPDDAPTVSGHPRSGPRYRRA